jgi:hypothetical protein
MMMRDKAKEKEAIRQADKDIREQLGVPFEDAHLETQCWFLMRSDQLTWNQTHQIRPVIRRLNRLWSYRRCCRASSHGVNVRHPVVHA